MTARQSSVERSAFQRKHSYKVMAKPQQVKMLEKIREAGLAANIKQTLFNNPVPSLVQKQLALKREGETKSPFLIE